MASNLPSRKNSPTALTALGNWLTAPSSRLTDITSRRQAQLAASLTLALITVLAIGGFFSSRNDLTGAIQAFGTPIVILSIAYIFIRSRFAPFGSFLLAAGFCASGYISIVLGNRDVSTNVLLYVPIALTVGSALLSWPAVFLLTGMNVGTTLLILPIFGITLKDNINGTVGVITAFGIVLSVLSVFRQSLEKERIQAFEQANQELMEIRENLEKRVEERTQELNRRSTQLEASTLVARSAAMVRDMSELLESVVAQISDRFGFYHTGIFLVDAGEKFVVLQAASSEGGKKLLKRGYKMEIGRQGVVGYAAYQKRPRIVQDVSTDSTYVKLSELASTRSEVALPLMVRNRVIGVLDIQSEESNVFKFDDIYTLQTMADQVALAIDNATLIEESRVALQQLETTNTTNTANVWKEYLQEGSKGFTYSPLGLAPLSKTVNTEQSDTERVIKVPLNLRGKAIGTLALKRKLSDPAWAESEREMAERVASQVALAVENARLLEESQRRAQREQKVNELSNRFSRSLDVDALLQNAIRELHSLPQVSEVAVLINPQQESSKSK